MRGNKLSIRKRWFELKKLEKNNVTVALNVLYAKKEQKNPAFVLKHNSNR